MPSSYRGRALRARAEPPDLLRPFQAPTEPAGLRLADGWTRGELARCALCGAGEVARYDVVLQGDAEEEAVLARCAACADVPLLPCGYCFCVDRWLAQSGERLCPVCHPGGET